MIDNSSIEQLKTHIDIVDVIGNYIELKKSGGNFKGLCPFHDEKTPSFHVNTARQSYKCFGCGAGGDAIKFVMEYEKLSYPEAIEKLADLFNFTLAYTETADKPASGKLLEQIGLWYAKNLSRTPFAKEYLEKRGVTHASMEKFALGYAPQSGQTLQFLQQCSVPLPLATKEGILASNERGYYARLSERIIFPIHNQGGKTVGFGGRTMGSHPAKYINSPQTRLFNKSRLLYGYHLAKEQIFRTKRMIVCEGYLDVILLHQAGFDTAVATLGTALTGEHLPLLKKGEPELLLAYDGDNAGIAAALKASRLLSAHNFSGGVVLFGDGMDPADMVHTGKLDALAKRFALATPFVRFVITQTAKAFDLKDPRGMESAYRQLVELIATLPRFAKEPAVSLAAATLGISSGMFRTKREKQGPARTVERQKDLAELAILKTLIRTPALIDMVLDMVDPALFAHHNDALAALIADREHEELLALEMDESVKPFNEEELTRQLRLMMIRHYENRLGRIKNDATIPFSKKSFLLRKTQDLIHRLKHGETVPYESDSTL